MSGEAGWNRLLAESERLRARRRARARVAVTSLMVLLLCVSLALLLPRDPHRLPSNRNAGWYLGVADMAAFAAWAVAPACMARWPRSGERHGWLWGAVLGQPVVALVWFGAAVAAHDAFDLAHPGWLSVVEQLLDVDREANTVLRHLIAAAVVAVLVLAAAWEVLAVRRDVRRLDALGGVPDCPRCRGSACVTWCAGR